MSQAIPMPPWALHFKMDDISWAALCQEADRNHFTPLDVALDLGLLNENKLIAWDCHLSGLASLRTVFFNGEAPLELWKHHDYRKCREQACMPVGQWDDKVIWAKLLSTPIAHEIENDPSRVWVLAPWSGMKKWFAQWQALVEPPVEKAEPQNDQGINITFDAPAGLKIDYDVKKAEDLIVGKLEDLMPVGLGKGIAEVAIDFSNIGLMTDEDHAAAVHVPQAPKPPVPPTPVITEVAANDAVPPAPAAPTPPAAPEPPTLAAIPKPTPPIPSVGQMPLVPPPIPLDAHSLPGIVIPPVPSAQKKMPPPPAPPSMATPVVQVIPVAKIESPIVIPMQAPLSMPSIPQPATPEVAFETDHTPLPSAGGDLPTIPLDQLEPRLKLTTNQESLAQVFMGAWQNYFDKIMILLFQSETLMIWWHNNRWRSQIPRGEKIPLDGPSIFKIVIDSLQPYHGYISPSEVNDLFFQKANAGEYAEHISVIPVTSGDHVVAVLVGTCAKSTGSTLVLSRLQSDAQVFAKAMARVQTLPKKAG